MRTFPLLIAACGIAVACDSRIQEPAFKTPTGLPGFNLIGIVRDDNGLPVPGATVLITFGVGRDLTTTANENGIFIFAGLGGLSTLRVSKIGYQSSWQTVVLNADQGFEFILVKAPPIELGRVIGGFTSEPPCDPVRWDERAPCRRFRFTPPSAGVLIIVVTWEGTSPLDATILTPYDTYLAFSEVSGFKQVTLQARVEAGVLYEVRVNSYYEGQPFDLTADFHRTSAIQ
jgi:hypothetical protein